jgi:hypothetical protein
VTPLSGSNSSAQGAMAGLGEHRYIWLYQVPQQHHGRIKGFVGHRHFSSLGTSGYLTSSVGTSVYSRLSGLMEAEGMLR